jgi:hypothetical protein
MADSIKPLTDEQRAILNEVSRVDWAFSAYRLVGEYYQIRAARDGWIANGKTTGYLCWEKKNMVSVSSSCCHREKWLGVEYIYIFGLLLPALDGVVESLFLQNNNNPFRTTHARVNNPILTNSLPFKSLGKRLAIVNLSTLATRSSLNGSLVSRNSCARNAIWAD